MNLILIDSDDFTDKDHVRITGRRQLHILNVHRPKVGDSLRTGLLNGPAGTGIVTGISAEAIEMDLKLDQEPPPPLPLTLLLALPRPKVLRRVLQAAASMGVKTIYLFNAYRVEKSYWKSPLLHAENIDEYLRLGLEQAKDTIMPEVRLRPLFRPFAEDQLPEIIRGTSALVADPGAEEPCPRGTEDRVTLAIGPEGGFIQFEMDMLAKSGFRPVSLGSRTLRVETVVPALLARLF